MDRRDGRRQQSESSGQSKGEQQKRLEQLQTDRTGLGEPRGYGFVSRAEQGEQAEHEGSSQQRAQQGKAEDVVTTARIPRGPEAARVILRFHSKEARKSGKAWRIALTREISNRGMQVKAFARVVT